MTKKAEKEGIGTRLLPKRAHHAQYALPDIKHECSEPHNRLLSSKKLFFANKTLYMVHAFLLPTRADHTHPESFKFRPEAPALWRKDIFLPPNRSIPLFCSGIVDPLRRRFAPWSGIIDPLRRSATPSDSMAPWVGREHASVVETRC